MWGRVERLGRYGGGVCEMIVVTSQLMSWRIYLRWHHFTESHQPHTAHVWTARPPRRWPFNRGSASVTVLLVLTIILNGFNTPRLDQRNPEYMHRLTCVFRTVHVAWWLHLNFLKWSVRFSYCVSSFGTIKRWTICWCLKDQTKIE